MGNEAKLYLANGIGWALVCVYLAITTFLCPSGYFVWEYVLYLSLILISFMGAVGSVFLSITEGRD